MEWYRIPAKIMRLPRSQIVDLVVAQWAVLRAQAAVWMRPRGELLQMTSVAAGDDRVGSEQRARELDMAIRRVVRFGLLRPQCLVRALALHRLLTGGGIRGSRIRIGVRIAESGFSAHAWVVWGSIVLGDDVRHTDQYATIADSRVAT